jgi:hypothetical protein
VRAGDLNQLSCFGKTVHIGELLDGKAHSGDL